VAVPGDAFLVVECFEQAFAQAYCNILDGMMCIDLQVAGGFNGQIDPAVLTKMSEHVIEKTYAAVDLIFTDAVKIKLDSNVGFFRLPVNLSHSIIHVNPRILSMPSQRVRHDSISFSA
jgi:hypothetical protein